MGDDSWAEEPFLRPRHLMGELVPPPRVNEVRVLARVALVALTIVHGDRGTGSGRNWVHWNLIKRGG